MQRVFMAGEAGQNAKCRWEGDVISPEFDVPGKDGKYVVVQWNRWTGRDQRGVGSREQVRRKDGLLEVA